MLVMQNINRNRELIKKAGGREAVGRLFGCTGQAVGLWYVAGVPAERVLKLCKFADYGITPHELRPDLYPHPDDGLPLDKRGLVSTQTNQETS